jgi:hypothetical protein
MSKMASYELILKRYRTLEAIAPIAFLFENDYSDATDDNLLDYLLAYNDLAESLFQLVIHFSLEIDPYNDAMLSQIRRHGERWKELTKDLRKLSDAIEWAIDHRWEEEDEDEDKDE